MAKRKCTKKLGVLLECMQYTYPKAKGSDTLKPKNKNIVNDRASSRSESVDASYSSASFESMDDDSEGDSFIADEESPSTGGMGHAGCKGVRRTIQVYCQTLEYWCTCDHDV